MIITLAELNKAVAALPEPHIAREMDRTHWRVPIVPDMPVSPLHEDMPPIGVEIRVAQFELKKVAKQGAVMWRWTPCDEIIID